MLNTKDIRKELQGASVISDEVIQHIHEEGLLKIWVPKKYGGLGYRFEEGLKALFSWAETDGSFGWMLTLCAGANYFSRNIKPEVAQLLFTSSNTCFGGSGMVGGTAEKQNDNTYIINGLWNFATGAPHLTHFTLNASITENGKPLLDHEGSEMIRSFIVPREQAEIIPNWKSMGMKASGTYSFTIENIMVSEDYSFVYDHFFTDDILDSVPFRVFADLTLLVNYLGMASHFIEEARFIRPESNFKSFAKSVEKHLRKVLSIARDIENILSDHKEISDDQQNEIHTYGTELTRQLSHQILTVYTQLGIRATATDSAIYQVFCDYFTAAMHSNFRPSADDLDFSF
ncbi:hypothetical protein SAMN06265171_101775 [Chryseobacterium rhizoplanae]|uniref:Acyl-CoA dehydrogenase n=1 Tax=Chryseobacterium rhizoplanae TaxID=1609531 RepID=A0A521B860_9FLAO|nr:hypothetical protein [Chryseobacterium rhizoplanae]SMO43302.1 hypothetical protein SAMN06265171_101775 [Chryseobacterium rhizoplanae]